MTDPVSFESKMTEEDTGCRHAQIYMSAHMHADSQGLMKLESISGRIFQLENSPNYPCLFCTHVMPEQTATQQCKAEFKLEVYDEVK